MKQTSSQTVKFPSNPFKSDDFEPLEITFSLGAPVMLSYPWIMFDAMVAHAVLEQQFPEILATLDSRVVADLSAMPLPLEKHEFLSLRQNPGFPNEMVAGIDFFYHASCSRFDVKATGTANIRKRICESDASHVTGLKKVDIVRGKLKAYDMRMVTITAPSCSFFCKGNKDAIVSLLEGITGLGKKRAAGFGRITGVFVSTTGSDTSIVHPGFGVNRPIPVTATKDLDLPGMADNVALLAYKPPYWDKSTHALCRVPDGFGG